jgi:hypothetical protein
MRVLCDFIGFNVRNHRLLYFDAFTGCLSEFAEFSSISVIFGAKLHKAGNWLETQELQMSTRALVWIVRALVNVSEHEFKSWRSKSDLMVVRALA